MIILGDLNKEIYCTQSIYDVINLIKNRLASGRVVYDKSINYFFVSNINYNAHIQLLEVAYQNGFYNNCNKLSDLYSYFCDNQNKFNIYLFFILNKYNESLEEDIIKLDYKVRYKFNFGYIYTKIKSMLEFSQLLTYLPKIQERIFINNGQRSKS